MNKGGKRLNSGRKKIEGKQVKIILEYTLLEEINKKFIGISQSEKIRNCIKKGLFKEEE